MDVAPWLVVGLGNPGPAYAGNRHNVGQMVLDELAERGRVTFTAHKANARIATARIAEGRIAAGPGAASGAAGARLLLAKPNSYMNLSGGPVSALLRFFTIPPARLVVVHDELDLPFDTVRLKRGGGAGGHNGVRDVAAATGTPEFLRVRVGVGRPPGRMPAADFVLRDFSGEERRALPALLADAADAVELLVASGLEAAQLRFHTAR
ncbi:MAG: aminoacyl-tRNA hydrolase [Microbacteriaceae bacterium]